MSQCPYCQSALPEPTERFCHNCGRELQAPPPPVPAEPESKRSGTPWERRGDLGFFPALVETTRQVVVSPTAFFRAMPVTGGVGAPLLYALLVGYVGLAAAVLYDAVFRAIVGPSFFGGPGALERMFPVLHGAFGTILQLTVGPIVLIAVLFVGSGVWHVVLFLLGGARRGFEATFRVSAYTEATAVFAIVPFCGWLVAFVYSLVVSIIGLAEAHGIGRGRAAAAVLAPLVLICCFSVAIGMAVGLVSGLVGHGR